MLGWGYFFVILALHPMKYPVLEPFSGIAAVFLGVVCAISGSMVRMPAIWYLGDALSCVVLGVLILVFWQRAKRLTKLSNML
jgi:integral membrane sensor domain MASE1